MGIASVPLEGFSTQKWILEEHEIENEMAEMEQALLQQHTLRPMTAQIDRGSITNLNLRLIYQYRQGQIPKGTYVRFYYVIANRPYTLGIEDVRYGHMKACKGCWGEIALNQTRVLQSHLNYHLNNGKYRLWIVTEREANSRSTEIYMLRREGFSFWIGPMTFQHMMVGSMCEEDQVALASKGTAASCAAAAASYWRCSGLFYMTGTLCTCSADPKCDLSEANPMTVVYQYIIRPSMNQFSLYHDPFWMHEREAMEEMSRYFHFPGEHWGEEPEHPDMELPEYEREHDYRYGGRGGGFPGGVPGFGMPTGHGGASHSGPIHEGFRPSFHPQPNHSPPNHGPVPHSNNGGSPRPSPGSSSAYPHANGGASGGLMPGFKFGEFEMPEYERPEYEGPGMYFRPGAPNSGPGGSTASGNGGTFGMNGNMGFHPMPTRYTPGGKLEAKKTEEHPEVAHSTGKLAKEMDAKSEKKHLNILWPIIGIGFGVGIIISVAIRRKYTLPQEPYLLDEYRDVESIEMDS